MKKKNFFPIVMFLFCGTMFMASSCGSDKKCELEPKEGFKIVGTDVNCYYEPVTAPEITYKIGDLYNVNGVKGIVFAVSADKKHGSMLAIETITTAQYQWATVYEITGATDTLDGAKNMATIKTMPNWATNYPAFKYWDDKGFYIPAKNELTTIFNNYTTIKTAVEKNGGSFDFVYSTTNAIYSSTEFSDITCYELNYADHNNMILFNTTTSAKPIKSHKTFILGIKKF